MNFKNLNFEYSNLQKFVTLYLWNVFQVYPEGIRKQLAWMKKEYGDIEILITENGYATEDGLEDYDRINYYKEHLEQVIKLLTTLIHDNSMLINSRLKLFMKNKDFS